MGWDGADSSLNQLHTVQVLCYLSNLSGRGGGREAEEEEREGEGWRGGGGEEDGENQQ